MNPQTIDGIDEICQKDSRYDRAAYVFVLEALSFTQKKHNRLRHVNGHELCQGIQDYLIKSFGPMTLYVLESWGISCMEDFGNIVFNLVENKLLSKTAEDSIEDFKKGIDFRETFDVNYRKSLKKKIRRMRSF